MMLNHLSEMLLFTAESVPNLKICFTNGPTPKKFMKSFQKIFFLCDMYFDFIKNLGRFSLFGFFFSKEKHSISLVNILQFGKFLGHLCIVTMKNMGKRGRQNRHQWTAQMFAY